MLNILAIEMPVSGLQLGKITHIDLPLGFSPRILSHLT